MTIKVTDFSESSLGIQIILETQVFSPSNAMDIEVTPRMLLVEKELRKEYDQLSGLTLTQVDHFENEQQWSFTANE